MSEKRSTDPSEVGQSSPKKEPIDHPAEPYTDDAVIEQSEFKEIETTESMRKRVRQIWSELGSLATSREYGRGFKHIDTSIVLLDMLAESDAKNSPEYHESIATKIEKDNPRDVFSGMDTQRYQVQFGDEAGVYNNPSQYDRIFFSMLICADTKRKIETALHAYRERLLNDSSKMMMGNTDGSELIAKLIPDIQTEDIDRIEPFSSHKEEYLAPARNFEKLIADFERSDLLKGSSILEVGGSGLQRIVGREDYPIAGQPNEYKHISSGKNEGVWFVPEDDDRYQHLTSTNYKDLLGGKQYDFTITRGVFDSGSGIQGHFKSEREATDDLLSVLSRVTKQGGYSIHEGNQMPPSKDQLERLGFELVIMIDTPRESHRSAPKVSNNILFSDIAQPDQILDESIRSEEAMLNHPLQVKEGVDGTVYGHTWILRKL